MAVRIISAVVGFLILLFFVMIGGLPMYVAAAALSMIGMHELYTAVSGKLKPVHFVGFAAELYYVIFGQYKGGFYNEYAILIAVIVLLVMLVAMHETTDIHDISITVFGFFYVGMLMFCLVKLWAIKRALVWLPLICAWGSDTFAYFVGVRFGRHKMAPVLSPKKSIEGAVGGIVGASVLTVIYSCVCYKLGFLEKAETIGGTAAVFALIGAAAAALSQVGDLAASAIKRQMGIKDYGSIMPGHGGILDRFDSVLVTAPTIYILVSVLLNY